MEWFFTIVPTVEKNGKIWIYIDFRNLNLATPKNEYPMPIADLLINWVARHEILSFMDDHSRYNKIYIAEKDVTKIALRFLGSLDTYARVVMPFGLKNAGATYQSTMNVIFYDMIGQFMKIYIDEVVVKSKVKNDHLEELQRTFERMEKYKLKINHLRCVLSVFARHFFGFLVH